MVLFKARSSPGFLAKETYPMLKHIGQGYGSCPGERFAKNDEEQLGLDLARLK